MGKRTNYTSVSRSGLLRRYAALRGVTVEAAERMTRDWSRTEFREVLESREREELPYEPRRVRPADRFTNVTGFTTMKDGITR